MDQQQFDIAAEIIAQDCTLVGQLKDGKGNFCAIGGLYTTIDPDWAVAERVDTDPGQEFIYQTVGEVFGLDFTKIWMANDADLVHGDTVELRRDRVLAALRAQLEAE